MTFSTFASPGVGLQGGGGSGSGGTPGGTTTQIQYNNAGAFAGASGLTTNGTNLTFGSASQLLWSTDLILTRRAAANLRLGAADAAAPVAQTLSVQSVVAGTSNTAGVNLTITGSQGTGTGAGGSIVFQVAPAGSSGTAQNALADALTITSTRQIVLGGTGATTASITGSAGSTSGIGFNSGEVVIVRSGNIHSIFNSTGLDVNLANARVTVPNGGYFAVGDASLYRDTSNTLALRNGANAQTFRVYNTTDGTNSELMAIAWTGNTCYIEAGKTGTGNARPLWVGTGGSADFSLYTNSNARWYITGSTGHFLAQADNTYDIGAATATRPRNLFLGSYAQLSEMTAPAAPATNDVRIYAEDNGSGKTRLMALFATGAAVQIAIEP